MSDTLCSTPLYLTGDMIAALDWQPQNQGNPGDADFGIVMPGVTALAGADSYYRLVWTNNQSSLDTATEFTNGQFWTLQIYDPAADPDGDPLSSDAGWSNVPGYTDMTPKHDLVSGLGAGDEYIVLEGAGGFLLYDINGGLPATATTLTYLASTEQGDTATGDNDGSLDFYDAYSAVCFCAGTRIDTIFGPLPVELLRVGMMVRTRDHAFQPLRRVGRRRVSADWLHEAPNLRPVRIATGALAPGRPGRDLFVSPQHRILMRSPIAARATGFSEVLVPAKALCGQPGIATVEAPGGVIYFHLLFDRHELIFANGAEAESLLTGPQALRALPRAARQEIFTLFPELRAGLPAMHSARPVLGVRRARHLAARHARNRKALQG